MTGTEVERVRSLVSTKGVERASPSEDKDHSAQVDVENNPLPLLSHRLEIGDDNEKKVLQPSKKMRMKILPLDY